MKKLDKSGAASASKVSGARMNKNLSVDLQLAQAQALSAAMPYNTGKALEFGRQNAVAPPQGASSSLES